MRDDDVALAVVRAPSHAAAADIIRNMREEWSRMSREARQQIAPSRDAAWVRALRRQFNSKCAYITEEGLAAAFDEVGVPWGAANQVQEPKP